MSNQGKQRITHASAKAKARDLQCWVCKKVSELTGYEWGTAGSDKPIESRGMGQPGVDVRMESAVLEYMPFSIECKRAETWRVQEWIEQARCNETQGTDWLLVAKRNRDRAVVMMDAEAFFNSLKRRPPGEGRCLRP